MFVSVFSKEQQSIKLLGGKGFGLWQMTADGLPVPPALIIPTSVCNDYSKAPKTTMKLIAKQLKQVKAFFVEQMGYMPLVSVRSGARVSMPGMMDTILNVGLSTEGSGYWAEKLGTACVVNSMSRLIEMYANVVDGLPRHHFEHKHLLECLDTYEKLTGNPFPNAEMQLLNSIEAVFKSWNNERAKVYRKLHSIPEDWGTAVVIQSMVFGNYNENSGTGVLFTRNVDSGENKVVGEFLINAQGEDVVAGIKTPMPLEGMADWNPSVYQELMTTVKNLEQTRKDVQDVEFTIQDGKLYILQTRNAKRSAQAAIKIALDMVEEGLIPEKDALLRVSRKQYAIAQLPVIDPNFNEPASFTGIPACSGVVSGVVVLSAKDAIDSKVPCILVTEETTPDDIAGMIAAKGVLTMKGGSTSHAAVVARSMNKACVVGLMQDIKQFMAGQTISIDGSTGRVWYCEVPVIESAGNEFMRKFTSLISKGIKNFGLMSKDPQQVPAVLDITHYKTNPELATKLIKERLKMDNDGFIVYAKRGNLHTDEFDRMFALPDQIDRKLIEAISSSLSAMEVSRIRLAIDCTPTSKHSLMVIKNCSTLEELIMAECDFTIDSELNPLNSAVAKVLDWRKSEGFNVLEFGNPNGQKAFLTEEHLLEMLP